MSERRDAPAARVIDESEALHARVTAFIEGRSQEHFDALALALHDYQARHVEPVGRLRRARLGEREPLEVADIPALPTDVFRLRRVAAHLPALDVRVFLTSGTTSGARGAHPLRTLRSYQAAAMRHADSLLFAGERPRAALVLAPSSAAAPESSLAFMIDLFVERLALPVNHVVHPERGLDLVALFAQLQAAERAPGPVLVMGTAFAYVHALDALAGQRSLRLPPGSRVMLTGGFKGRSREVPEVELRVAIAAALGVEPGYVVGEYGMTELSSQLYEPHLLTGAEPVPSRYRPPAWLRVSAVDPETLAPLPVGEVGLARFVDLANVDSSIGVQTQDLVRVLEGGDLLLLGRAPGATPRGCSLATEEILAP